MINYIINITKLIQHNYLHIHANWESLYRDGNYLTLINQQREYVIFPLIIFNFPKFNQY